MAKLYKVDSENEEYTFAVMAENVEDVIAKIKDKYTQLINGDVTIYGYDANSGAMKVVRNDAKFELVKWEKAMPDYLPEDYKITEVEDNCIIYWFD